MVGQEEDKVGVATTGACFSIRALARGIDVAFGCVVGFIAGVFASVILFAGEQAGTVSPGWQERVQGISLIGILVSLIGSIAYHTICEGLHGATVGKIVCRLRVRRADGNGRSLYGALKRNLAVFVDSLFLGAVAYESMKNSDLQQRIGDKWGGTVVVRTSDSPKGASPSIWWFVLSLFLGATVWGVALTWMVVVRGR